MDTFWNILQQWTNSCMNQFYYLFTNSVDSLFGSGNRQMTHLLNYVRRASMGGKNSSCEKPSIRNRFGSIDGQCPICLMSLQLPVETNCGHLFCGNCIITYWKQPQWENNSMCCPVCRQMVTLLLTCFRIKSINNKSSRKAMLTRIKKLYEQFRIYLKTILQPFIENITSVTILDFLLESSDQNQEYSADESSTRAMNNNSSDESINIRRPEYVMNMIRRYNRKFSNQPKPWIDYIYDLPALLRHLVSDLLSTERILDMFRVRIMLLLTAAITYLISPLDMIPEAVFGLFGLFDDILILLLLAIYATIIYRRFLIRAWQSDSHWIREEAFDFD